MHHTRNIAVTTKAGHRTQVLQYFWYSFWWEMSETIVLSMHRWNPIECFKNALLYNRKSIVEVWNCSLQNLRGNFSMTLIKESTERVHRGRVQENPCISGEKKQRWKAKKQILALKTMRPHSKTKFHSGGGKKKNSQTKLLPRYRSSHTTPRKSSRSNHPSLTWCHRYTRSW